MFGGAIKSFVWPVIRPQERLSFWQGAMLVAAGLAASTVLRLAFAHWMQGQTLFIAFLPAILVVTLRGGVLAGVATLLMGKSLALMGVAEPAAMTPRVLLWAVAGAIIILAANAARELLRAERAQRCALVAREARTLKIVSELEVAAQRAAREKGHDDEVVRLAATLGLLRTAIENPDQLNAVGALVTTK